MELFLLASSPLGKISKFNWSHNSKFKRSLRQLFRNIRNSLIFFFQKKLRLLRSGLWWLGWISICGKGCGKCKNWRNNEQKTIVLYQNQLLNSEVGFMVRNNTQLSKMIDTVQETMKDVKNSIKNATFLRNLTPCRPNFHKKTRWTDKHDVLEKWTIIRDVLMEARMDDESNFRTNCSQLFDEKIRKF